MWHIKHGNKEEIEIEIISYLKEIEDWFNYER
jgi:hypothetical protein